MANKANELADWLRTWNLKWKNLNLLAVYQCSFWLFLDFILLCISNWIVYFDYWFLCSFLSRSMRFMCVAWFDFTILYREKKQKKSPKSTTTFSRRCHLIRVKKNLFGTGFIRFNRVVRFPVLSAKYCLFKYILNIYKKFSPTLERIKEPHLCRNLLRWNCSISKNIKETGNVNILTISFHGKRPLIIITYVFNENFRKRRFDKYQN